MLLLHISDIHFRYPECAEPESDPERPYRTRLLQDVQRMVATLGKVDAILIGGDVAFRGLPAEYDAALIWIKELANDSGCDLERVFVVPGNHDVDQAIIKAQPTIRNVQQAIINAPDSRKERELRDQFRHEETGRALLAPLAAYNDFARNFSCQIYPPRNMFWRQDVDFTDTDTVKLRIYGLTSTILSGAGVPNGKQDNRESLYLSPLQTVLDPIAGVVNLVMCHHPPDWFMDQDAVDDAIKERAGIHLFGHKHRQRIQRETGFVRFSAGAVNPDRNELGWQPGYNLFKLSVSTTGTDQYLDIEAHLRALQTSPERFTPIFPPEGGEVFKHRIPILGRPSPKVTNEAIPIAIPALDVSKTAEVEAAMGEEHTRNLVLRFWKLASSQRREIAQRLSLLEEGEMAFPEAERYGRALLRAGERNLLKNLSDEIERMERS
jgi:predicted phosphodiesterase